LSVVNQSNKEMITVGSVSFNMIRVEGGTFQMGATSEQGSDAHSNEKPAHQVTLSSFSIGETEVTQELWKAVMGSNPSKYKGKKHPVELVSWNDCQEFIRKLNDMTGKKFRLPTEAEWEYAARGGKKSLGYKYSGSNAIDDVAWYTNTTKDKGTHDVKTKKTNELELYDMSGNVWEWCQDRYGNNSRVIRGGGWDCSARGCRVPSRGDRLPDNVMISLGLRLAQ
jgi:formylglycine-generating enzyme required for sulfatase activity